MVMVYIVLCIFHLILGAWMAVGVGLFIESCNPILKPVILLFWPIGAVMLLWVAIQDWLEEVKEFYKED